MESKQTGGAGSKRWRNACLLWRHVSKAHYTARGVATGAMFIKEAARDVRLAPSIAQIARWHALWLAWIRPLPRHRLGCISAFSSDLQRTAHHNSSCTPTQHDKNRTLGNAGRLSRTIAWNTPASPLTPSFFSIVDIGIISLLG